MNSQWVICNHHIAIDDGESLLHPDAAEIYSFIADDPADTGVPDPMDCLREIRFSKVGSPVLCELFTDDSGRIVLELYAVRKNTKCPVDIVEGHIMDHCLYEKEWFYISGDLDTLQELLHNAGIKNSGVISLGQYLNLMKQECFSDHKEINDRVEHDVVSQMLVPAGQVPSQIKADLYSYQKTGYLWMKSILDAVHGCILGDEMGLGKTLQVITLFQDYINRGNVPVLVVAPVSLLENWRRECSRFAPGIKVFVHHGSRRTGRYKELLKHDVIVISYNTAVSDLSMLKMINWKCVVLDEAQNIKNPNSERAKAVKAITRVNSIAVTGTPFENHITDIWSLMDFCVPGLLGTQSSFESNVPDDLSGAGKIEPILSSVMIRRLVKDVADDLPEKIVATQPLVMSDNEREMYERYRQEAMESTQNGSAVTLSVLQKLRMFCTHYTLVETDDSGGDPELNSIKYQRFCELTAEIICRNEKVIVFTTYKKMFDIILKDVPYRFGIKTGCINGDTPVEDRQRIVDDFNSYSGAALLVLNPRAAGTGLNITGANHVIHYNPEWNPSLEDQSSARAYRRGQKKTVFIYRLYYVDTVEQIVNERIERKREMAHAAVVGNDGEGTDRNDILRALQIAPQLSKKG